MATTYGNKLSVWSTYLDTTFEGTYSNTQARLTISVGVYFNSKHEHTKDYDTYSTTPSGSTSNTTISGSAGSGDVTQNAGTKLRYTTRTILFNRTTTAFTGKITASIKHAKGTESWRGTSTTSQTFTIPARSSHSVVYNANKPSNARQEVVNVPSSQTKYYGYNINLQSSSPSLANWVFTGWNTVASGSGGTSYSPGALYTVNQTTTQNLYAQWSKIYITPTLSNIEYQRVDDNLNEDDEGNYLRITFDHTVGQVPDDETVNKATTVTVKLNNNPLTLFKGTTTFNSSGTKTIVYNTPTSNYPTSNSYPITITLVTEDSVPTVTYTDILSSAIYPIDLSADATSIAFGVNAVVKQDLIMAVEYPATVGSLDEQLYTILDSLGWWDTIENGGIYYS